LIQKHFRPITILSCLGKLFTAILNERLWRFSEEALLMNENQFGFRKSYSTTDSIFTLFSFFEILKWKKKKLFCAFVDFEKAFETVWRDALWNKLLLNHINGKMYIIILNMYKDVKSCVTYNYCKADYFLWYGSEARGKLITFSVCYVPKRFIKCFLKMQILMV
jgi:hypothetical protein